ncbi:hypothetical protein Tco_0443241 [Tanacetum coccineum]
MTISGAARVDVRTYLLCGAIDGSEANGIIRNPKLELESSRFTFDLVPLSYESVDVVVGKNWLLRHKAELVYHEKVVKMPCGFHRVNEPGGVRVAREDDRGVTEGREDVREVFQQRGSGSKRKLSRCGRNQMGNEPILALPEGADDFVVYYDARSKDLKACLEKGRRVILRIMTCSNTLSISGDEHEAKMLYRGVGRRSEAKNEFEIDVRRSDLEELNCKIAEQDIPPPTITAMKIPIIRKGEYDIWSMRMRQYICHTNHNLWDVIVNGDLEEELAPTTGETSAPPAPKTAKQLAARRNQEREAIKSRFGGNEESKKIQKNVLKHQFKIFTTASNESLDKAYDRFQKLISQLEVHGAPISKEDINQKFLRSLPPLWNQVALIMRNKPDIDEIDINDLYNNLRVYGDEMKRSSSSTSNSQNLAFLSSENTNSTNEVSTASGDIRVSTAGGTSQVLSTPCAHDIDGDDLEELDLLWQVAMLTVKVKKFIQRTKRNMDFKEKRHVSLDKSKIECYKCHKKGILLGNAYLEGIKGEDLMVTMAGAMHQQMNLHHMH